jgi:outer membrane biosynthesis protein TonB
MEAILMKVLGVISTTAMFLLLGSAVPAFAQEEHHEEAAKPAQHEEAAKPAKQEEAKPAKQEAAKPAKQEEAKPAKQEAAKPAKQEQQAKTEKPAKQAKPAEQEKQAKSEKQAQAKPAKQEKQAKPAEQEKQAKSEKQGERGKTAGQQHAQRTPAEEQRQRSQPALRLSARGSGRIPDDRFRSNFGREHTFVINEPVMVGGFSRFQYGGFWFGFENPWPEGWYYTDNVYVDFIDGGYYLCNPYYPGARVGISVVI